MCRLIEVKCEIQHLYRRCRHKINQFSILEYSNPDYLEGEDYLALRHLILTSKVLQRQKSNW
jgi:hypothetical protein